MTVIANKAWSKSMVGNCLLCHAFWMGACVWVCVCVRACVHIPYILPHMAKTHADTRMEEHLGAFSHVIPAVTMR